MLKINEERLRALSPSKQQLFLGKLEELAAYKKVNPLYFYNHPIVSEFPQHERQLQFHELVKRFRTVALFGGNQSGKTIGGIADDLIQAVDEDVLPSHLLRYKKWQPPFYCRIFTPDLTDTGNAFREKMSEMVPISQLLGENWDKAYNEKNRMLRFKNGSWMQFNSYDQEIKKLGTITLHRIHYDEEPPEGIYTESQPRLARYMGDQIFTMTPQHGLSWTWDKVWHRSGGKDSDADFEPITYNEEDKIASIVVDVEDNPSLTPEAIEDLLKEYGPLMRRARKSGRFVHMSGLVYGEEFNEQKHVATVDDPAPFRDKNVNVVVSIDPGWNYTAVLWGAYDSRGHCTIFEELFLENWTIEQVCEQIFHTNAFHGIEPIFYIIDPNAKDTSKQTGRDDMSEYRAYGINSIPGQKSVTAGINRVKTYFKNDDITILSNCRNLLRELNRYRWKEPPKSGEDRTEGIVVKKEDHCVDSLRYNLMSRPYLPEEPVEDNRTEFDKWVEEDRRDAFQPVGVSEFGGDYGLSRR